MAKKKSKNGNKTKKSPIRNIWIIIAVVLLAVLVSFLLDKWTLGLVNIIQNDFLFDVFYIITFLGDFKIFIWIIVFLSILFLINKKPLLPLLVSITASALTNILLKWIINRPRPFEHLDIASVITTSSSSFPSGHAMIMFCTLPVLSKNFPSIKAVFWIIAIMVSLSRVYLGVHYFSDILFGALLGYLIGWLSLKMGEKYGWKY